MAKATEKYEVMYIINPNFTEEQTAAVVEKFKALVEAHGTLDELEEMGKRKLAYEINYISEGYYVLMKFTSGADFPAPASTSAAPSDFRGALTHLPIRLSPVARFGTLEYTVTATQPGSAS